MSMLVALSGPDKGRTWAVGKDTKTMIGRVQACQVCVSDGRVSRRHCALIVAGGGVVIEDLASANGTFVNGAKVSRAELKAGDRLRIGHSEFEFQPKEAPAAQGGSLPLPAVEANTAPTKPIISAQRRIASAGPLKLEFCTRCAVSIDTASLASGSARRIDGELLCSECASAGVAAAKVVGKTKGAVVADKAPAAIAPAVRAAGSTAAAPAPRLARPAQPMRPGSTRAKGVKPVTGSKERVAAPASSRRVARAGSGRVSAGRQVWAYVSLAVTLTILGACVYQVPGAWLNFRRLIGPSGVTVAQVPVTEVSRSPVSVTLGYTLKPENGPEVQTTKSAGFFGKFKYDDLVRQAEERKKELGPNASVDVNFEIVYDKADPKRSALIDQLFGLPVLLVGLISLCWASREVWQISKFYRRPAEG